MSLVAPDYYTNFKCTASACRHSCCTGWEIDIDADTYEYYKTIEGSFGTRLKNSIAEENGTAHFILAEGDRCPFLNKNGLCDIITEYGEEALCQICDDHPRYRNFYSGRTEIGVGLCCEAAAMLVLSQQEKMSLVFVEGETEEDLLPEETEFLQIRDKLFTFVQNREKPLLQRVKDMLGYCGINMPRYTAAHLADMLIPLERLDESWEDMLLQLKNAVESSLILPHNNFETAFEQLLCYFLYRHLADSLDDGYFIQRIIFAVISCRVIYLLSALHYHKKGSLSLEDIAEYARLYSSEIEYSQDNMDSLLEYFAQ